MISLHAVVSVCFIYTKELYFIIIKNYATHSILLIQNQNNLVEHIPQPRLVKQSVAVCFIAVGENIKKVLI